MNILRDPMPEPPIRVEMTSDEARQFIAQIESMAFGRGVTGAVAELCNGLRSMVTRNASGTAGVDVTTRSFSAHA